MLKKLSFICALVVLSVWMNSNLSKAQTSEFQSIKKFMKPAVKNGGFAMDGYILWCSTVIKTGNTYHMFASRWPAQYGLGGWTTYSECVRATSDNLYGPYTFQEVVLQKRLDSWDKSRIHNVKIVKTGSKYVLYYINSANQTGYAEAEAITGPWTRTDAPVIHFSNPAILAKPDGSIYVFGRLRDSTGINRGVACTASSYKGPYTMVAGGKNLLPNNYELEDPTIWWANNQYNIICNDWKSKATGKAKGGAQYYSKNGIDYTLATTEPIFARDEPVIYDDGSTEMFERRERPFAYVNEKGEVMALFTACLVSAKLGPAKIVVQPVDHYVPNN
jgi:hypothetical protein